MQTQKGVLIKCRSCNVKLFFDKHQISIFWREGSPAHWEKHGLWSEKDDVWTPVFSGLEFLLCRTGVIMPSWGAVMSFKWYRRCKLLRPRWRPELEHDRDLWGVSFLWHCLDHSRRSLCFPPVGSSSWSQGIGDAGGHGAMGSWTPERRESSH